ncbi:hypothetical protein FB561_3182 [Kribbella amoyensis]|uniref:Uncharacterized protein n=1 Tax=Kribbella amoyensis TaxID=996641 RepID=A0A561BT59_9ACTN|nr:hypothetical protein [Kribbella amoyensis]TWD82056.1 hypothetical protein FB561_3182 [Kribbella amoyensis]
MTATDRWADRGDPALARRLALMWGLFALVAWLGAGLTAAAWWVAQAGEYQENYRGFNAGDSFPWIAVALLVVAGLGCVPVAIRQYARARRLAQAR